MQVISTQRIHRYNYHIERMQPGNLVPRIWNGRLFGTAAGKPDYAEHA